MDKTQTASIIIGKLLNIGGLLQSHGNKMLQPYGLNQQQFSIFFEIAKVGKVKQKDIVNRLELEKGHVSKVVKKLHSLELISIKTSSEDNRSVLLSPTPKGKKILKQCMEMFTNWNDKWLAEINKPTLLATLDNLTLLQKTFQKHAHKNQL